MGSSSVLFYVSMEITLGQFRSGESGLVTVGERSLRDSTKAAMGDKQINLTPRS